MGRFADIEGQAGVRRWIYAFVKGWALPASAQDHGYPARSLAEMEAILDTGDVLDCGAIKTDLGGPIARALLTVEKLWLSGQAELTNLPQFMVKDPCF